MSNKSAAAARELRRKKVAANLVGGLTYRQMAETFGCSLGTVARDVRIILNRWRREQMDDIESYVLLQLQRLDRMLNAIWDRVIDGDLQAIDRALKIMERQAKLLGLDMPEKKETTTTGTLAVANVNQWDDLDEQTLDLMTKNLLIASGYLASDLPEGSGNQDSEGEA